MQFNYRNIQELIISWGKKDAQLYEALKRVNNLCIDLSKFLNNPTFAKLEVGELIFTTDRNQLSQASAMTQACKVWHSVAQSIPSGVLTTLVFNTNIIDTDGMHDVVVNNSRIIIKTPGIYLIGAGVAITANATGYRQLTILANGGAQASHRNLNVGAAINAFIEIQTLVKLAQNDYIEVAIVQDSGIALDVLSVTPVTPLFWVHRLS